MADKDDVVKETDTAGEDVVKEADLAADDVAKQTDVPEAADAAETKAEVKEMDPVSEHAVKEEHPSAEEGIKEMHSTADAAKDHKVNYEQTQKNAFPTGNDKDIVQNGHYEPLQDTGVPVSLPHISQETCGSLLSLAVAFLGIFCLLNVNIAFVASNMASRSLLMFNFVTIGAVSFLTALINTFLPGHRKTWILWLACALAFAAAVLIQF